MEQRSRRRAVGGGRVGGHPGRQPTAGHARTTPWLGTAAGGADMRSSGAARGRRGAARASRGEATAPGPAATRHHVGRERERERVRERGRKGSQGRRQWRWRSATGRRGVELGRGRGGEIFSEESRRRSKSCCLYLVDRIRSRRSRSWQNQRKGKRICMKLIRTKATTTNLGHTMEDRTAANNWGDVDTVRSGQTFLL